MGARADFYARNGEAIEWLGSVAWDGYLWAEQEDSAIREASTSDEFRCAVAAELAGRDDATLPIEGWPWPWDDSRTTDYAYLFDGDKGLRIFSFGREVNEDRETAEKWDGFPNMAEQKNVQWGAKSGVIVVGSR